MEADHDQQLLGWLPIEYRQQVFQARQLYLAHSKEEQFIKIGKIAADQIHQHCIRKTYLCYSVYPDLYLQPILHIFIRLQIDSIQLKKKYYSAILKLINRPCSYIQKIYKVQKINFSSSQHKCYNVLNVKSQVYRFSFQHLLQMVISKKIPLFSNDFVDFAKSFAIMAYISILDMLMDKTNDDLNFTFDFSNRNILFDRFYHMMVGNLIYGSNSKPLPAFTNEQHQMYIHSYLIQQIKQFLVDVFKYSRINNQQNYQEDITYLFFSRTNQYFNLQQQFTKARQFKRQLRIKEFPSQQIYLELYKAEQVLSGLNNRLENERIINLSHFHLQQERRDEQQMKAIIRRY